MVQYIVIRGGTAADARSPLETVYNTLSDAIKSINSEKLNVEFDCDDFTIILNNDHIIEVKYDLTDKSFDSRKKLFDTFTEFIDYDLSVRGYTLQKAASKWDHYVKTL